MHAPFTWEAIVKVLIGCYRHLFDQLPAMHGLDHGKPFKIMVHIWLLAKFVNNTIWDCSDTTNKFKWLHPCSVLCCCPHCVCHCFFVSPPPIGTQQNRGQSEQSQQSRPFYTKDVEAIPMQTNSSYNKVLMR